MKKPKLTEEQKIQRKIREQDNELVKECMNKIEELKFRLTYDERIFWRAFNKLNIERVERNRNNKKIKEAKEKLLELERKYKR